MKAELKNIQRFKSYGQNKIFYKIVAKNGRFPLYFGPKLQMVGRSHGCEKKSFLFDILSVKVLSEPHEITKSKSEKVEIRNTLLHR